MSKGSRMRPSFVSNEEYATRWDAIFHKEEKQKCGCGRSASGLCDGSHSLSEEEYDRSLFDDSTEK